MRRGLPLSVLNRCNYEGPEAPPPDNPSKEIGDSPEQWIYRRFPRTMDLGADPLFLGVANFLGGLSGGGASGPSYLHLLKTDSGRPRLIKSLRVHSRFIINVRHKTRFSRLMAEKRPLPAPEVIAYHFVSLYYEIMAKRPGDLYQFYEEGSTFSFSGDGQVNTVVGLFWIMLKISTWLVVFFVPPKKTLLPFVPLFTICIISPKTEYAKYCIDLIATL